MEEEVEEEEEEEEEEESFNLWQFIHPANNALSINFLLSPDAKFFVSEAPTEHPNRWPNVQKKKKKRACDAYMF